jgi:hypothetical protein
MIYFDLIFNGFIVVSKKYLDIKLVLGFANIYFYHIIK